MESEMSLKNLLLFGLIFSTTIFPDSPGANPQLPGYLLVTLILIILILMVNITVTFLLVKKFDKFKSSSIEPQGLTEGKAWGQEDELKFAQNIDNRNSLEKKLEGHINTIKEMLTELKLLAYYNYEDNEPWNFHLVETMNGLNEKVQKLQQSVDSQVVAIREVESLLRKIQVPVIPGTTPVPTDKPAPVDNPRPQSNGRIF